ncbi:MAG TPA: alkylmercury lyase family protein [Pseudonocardiaceae bacterium]|nr:alkylmercury lyase family protein [Pseudonocardiaceae bacterium]
MVLNKASETAALSPAARAAHRRILTAFAETGHADACADACADAETLAELVEHDVLALDESGGIRAAYPFSPVPTGHRVAWDGGEAYAMCAIDALGMSAMLGVPVTITSTEPDTEQTVTVHVDNDTARWEPETAVVFSGQAGDSCCPSVDRTCGNINFFTSADAGNEWAARNPGVVGIVLDQRDALAAGVAEFGAML